MRTDELLGPLLLITIAPAAGRETKIIASMPVFFL
jgi:hypothetical protein